VLPDDELNSQYWTEIADDLVTLETEGSIGAFRAELRKHDLPSMESARTELFFAAWLKRSGFLINLEPRVGSRRCEFTAGTTPETWWEIKTPLDLPEVQQDAAVLTDIQRRLRTIDQPYVLGLVQDALTLERVPAAVKAIKRELYAYYRAGGILPREFESDGLRISLDSITRRSKGYLGVTISKPQVFQNQNSAHVVRRVIEAADQIPAAGGGIVVIDRSSSDYIHHEDLIDACYGELRGVVQGGRLLDVRLSGAFEERGAARISAVASFTRTWPEEQGILMTVLHNPSALIPLPNDVLTYEGVRHTRRVDVGDRYRLVTTPGEID
jgi:hypothetical protein